MGQWQGPDDTDALLAALEELDPMGIVMSPVQFINAIRKTGLLVRKAYYVPDADELRWLMKTWQYHLRRADVGCRWVMCRETVDALDRKWNRVKTTAPVTFDSGWWASSAGQEMPPAVLEMEILMVIEANQRWDDTTRLFGWPIRIDPAARSPLFEIDTDATTTKPMHVP